MRYIDSVNKEIKDYFKILEPDFPEWLNEYIDTKGIVITAIYKCDLWYYIF